MVKFTFEDKITAIELYLSRKESYESIGQSLKTDEINIMDLMTCNNIGRRCPNFTLIDTNQKKHTLYEMMPNGRFVLILSPDHQSLADKLQRFAHRVNITAARIERSEFTNMNAMLIRPDGHIAWTHSSNEKRNLEGKTLAMLQIWCPLENSVVAES